MPTNTVTFVDCDTGYCFELCLEVFGEKCSACHDAMVAAIATGDVAPKGSMTVAVTVGTNFGPGLGGLGPDADDDRLGQPGEAYLLGQFEVAKHTSRWCFGRDLRQR